LSVPTPSKERTGALEKSPLAKAPEREDKHKDKGTKYGLHTSTLGPLVDRTLKKSSKSSAGPEKILLRVDAFLGEWLSPDYYEDITPPPNSTMMVASAKADLLRRGDYIQEMSNTSNSKGFFPGGWVGKATAAISRQGTVPVKGSLASMPSFRERSNSHGSVSLERTKSRENVAAALASPVELCHTRIYQPPVPSYSVSASDPLPRGYFAHAREACILVDYQWDSMRPPQEWGDGGEYGDEWSTMHKRFRRGLTGMMEWYRTHGTAPPKEQISGFMFREPLRLTPVPKRPNVPTPSLNGELKTDDDEELVLILLTHGAGCNALLGAMSNQPVLIDVGLASLSMAVLRDKPRNPSDASIQERRPSVADPGMSDTYDMKLMASIDHLKPGTDPSRLRAQSQASSPVVPPAPSLDTRKQRLAGSPLANSPSDSPFSLGEPLRNWNSSLGSARRASSSGSSKMYTQSNLNPSVPASPAVGLWSGSKTTPASGTDAGDGRATPGADMVLNFAVQQPTSNSTVSNATNEDNSSIPSVDGAAEVTNSLARLNTNEEKEVSDNVAPLTKPHARTSSNSSTGLWGAKSAVKSNAGLWGPPRLDDVYEHRPGPKRRWTVTDREESL
jgi:hypothetical protein